MQVLKIGVVMDPVDKINIDKDTTFVLMLEAQQRGHEVYYMELDDLFIRGGAPYGGFPPPPPPPAPPPPKLGGVSTGALKGVDSLSLRKTAPLAFRSFFS